MTFGPVPEILSQINIRIYIQYIQTFIWPTDAAQPTIIWDANSILITGVYPFYANDAYSIFIPYFSRIYKFPLFSIFSFLGFPYSDHDAFMHHPNTYWTSSDSVDLSAHLESKIPLQKSKQTHSTQAKQPNHSKEPSELIVLGSII